MKKFVALLLALTLCIRLCANGRKVDLEKSPILIHLKKQKAGN